MTTTPTSPNIARPPITLSYRADMSSIYSSGSLTHKYLPKVMTFSITNFFKSEYFVMSIEIFLFRNKFSIKI